MPTPEALLNLSFAKAVDLRPEPLEQALYTAVAVGGPVLAWLLLFLVGGQPSPRAERHRPRWIWGIFALALLSALGGVAGRHRLFDGFAVAPFAILVVYFYRDVGGRASPIRAWFCRLRPLAWLAPLYVVWRCLPALGTDCTLANNLRVLANLDQVQGEFLAPLNGLFPYFSFQSQYNSVLPVLTAPWFQLFGTGSFAATGLFFLLDLFLFWTSYRLLRVAWPRRATAQMLLGLLAAFAAHPILNGPEDYVHPFTYYAVGPIRYVGPFAVSAVLLAVLTHTSPLRVFALGAVAALAAWNNLDFGIPAFGGAACALVFWLRARKRSLSTSAWFLLGAGVSSAAFFGTLTLYLEQPPFRMVGLFEFQRIFAASGFFMLPMPLFGLHWILLALAPLSLIWVGVGWIPHLRTPAPVILRSTERRLRRATILVFLAITTIGAAMYFVGRSHEWVLPALFLFWGLLALLAWREVWDRRFRAAYRPALILGLLFFALCIEQTFVYPQDGRLLACRSDSFIQNLAEKSAWVRNLTSTAETGFFLTHYGNRIACDTRHRNLSPYVNQESVPFRAQTQKLFEIFRQRMPDFAVLDAFPELTDQLATLGYHAVGHYRETTLWRRSSPPIKKLR